MISERARVVTVVGLVGLAMGLLAGCGTGPRLVPASEQKPIDRAYVVYPSGTDLYAVVEGLTAPTAIAWDNQGAMLVAEGGVGGHAARIVGFRRDNSIFEVWPRGRQLPFGLGADKFVFKGPIGGMVAAHGKVYVTHRDADNLGVITAFDYNGGHTTVVGGLPARGDYSVTDIALGPTGRLYFGVGAATNSAVVGLDNMPWLRKYRDVCDRYCPPGAPAERRDLSLLGRRFDTPNPFAGLFGGTDIAVTGPYQPFGRSIQTRIQPVNDGMCGAAIYSIDPGGGAPQLEAHGIRYPMGLGFHELGGLYMSNQGMKLRGTRPVWHDPDVLLRLVPQQWYGWPDYSANLLPIRDPQFQPEPAMIVRTGYPDLSFLIDHNLSKLTPPEATRERLLAAEFPWLAGAAKFDFAPGSGPFKKLHDTDSVIVAMFGDRAPFDSGGKPVAPTGYKVVQVPLDGKQVSNFVSNTVEGPASRRGDDAVGLERPIDVKFGPDGSLYILDFGQMKMRNGQEQVKAGTGRIYKLVATEVAPKP